MLPGRIGRMKGSLRYGRLAAISSSRKRFREVKHKPRKKLRATPRRALQREFLSEGEQNHEQLQQYSEEEAKQTSGDVLEESVSLVANVEEAENETTSNVVYNGNMATVHLSSGQAASMDGCAMVSVLKGSASMLGYSLHRGIEVFVCSSAKISPAVCFEPLTASDSKNLKLKDSCDCVLRFKSTDAGSHSEDSATVVRPTFKIVVSAKFVTSERNTEHLNLWSCSTNGPGLESEGGTMQSRQRGTVGADDATRGESSPESADDGDEMDVDSPAAVGRKRGIEDGEAGGNKKRKDAEEDMRSLVLPPSWRSAADVILLGRSEATNSQQQDCFDTPVVAICGPKNAGKSTFGRYLVNNLLNRFDAVGYLDTDLGQPEFTVPGCLSLHVVEDPVTGPPAFHLRNPERCFYFGDSSPKSNPELYVRQVVNLHRYFQERYANTSQDTVEDVVQLRKVKRIPLVINTHGWLKGVGYELLVRLLSHTRPTHVVQVCSQAQGKNLPRGKFWVADNPDTTSDTTTVLYISSPAEADSVAGSTSHVGRSATHMRGLRLLAYFQQCFGRGFSSFPFPFKEARLFMETALQLVCHRPYVVSASDVTVLHLHSEVPKCLSLCSINGALVGLGVSGATLDSPEPEEDGEQQQPVCIGFAIVRSVDLIRKLIYVLTPLSLDELVEVKFLLQGRVKLPVPMLQAKGLESPYLCSNSIAVEGTGAAVMRAHKGTPRKYGTD